MGGISKAKTAAESIQKLVSQGFDLKSATASFNREVQINPKAISPIVKGVGIQITPVSNKSNSTASVTPMTVQQSITPQQTIQAPIIEEAVPITQNTTQTASVLTGLLLLGGIIFLVS